MMKYVYDMAAIVENKQVFCKNMLWLVIVDGL